MKKIFILIVTLVFLNLAIIIIAMMTPHLGNTEEKEELEDIIRIKVSLCKLPFSIAYDGAERINLTVNLSPEDNACSVKPSITSWLENALTIYNRGDSNYLFVITSYDENIKLYPKDMKELTSPVVVISIPRGEYRTLGLSIDQEELFHRENIEIRLSINIKK